MPSYPYAERMAGVTSSAIMELLKTAGSGNYLSFASGLPDPTLFPVKTLRNVTEAVLSHEPTGALQYGPSEGYGPLREWVAAQLRKRGFPALVENILLTSGSQQGLDLAARAFLDTGEKVCVESPTYLAALQTFDSFGVPYLPVPQDEEGMDMEAVERALRSGCKLLYALPNFQNPTGRTLSVERRERLVALLQETGTILLEDDAYYDLRYEGDTLPPIGSLMSEGLALYTGTFSKTITPGLRVGYLYGPAEVIARLSQLKQITDLHTGSLSQHIVYRFVMEGHFAPQVTLLCDAYRAKRDAMLTALEEAALEGVRWTRPAGGMFIWVTLPETQESSVLLQAAMQQGLLFVPGRGFHPDGRGANTLRLTFVNAPLARIAPGMVQLAELMRTYPAVTPP